MEYRRKPWNITEMENRENTMVYKQVFLYNGMQWNIMECNGIAWNIIEFDGMSWNTLQWNIIE